VHLIDSDTRERRDELKTRKGYARALAWTEDSERLIVGEYQSISIWDADSGKRLKRLRGHRGYVTGLVLTEGGLLSASLDGTVRRWDLETGDDMTVADFEEIPVQDLAVSLDESLLAVALGDETAVTEPGPVVLLDAQTGEELHRFEPHEKVALAIAFVGDRLVSGSEDELVLIHDVSARKTIAKNSDHSRPINDFAVLDDGVTVVSGSGGRAVGKNEIFVWSSLDGTRLGTVEAHAKKVAALAVSPDGRVLVSGGYDKSVAFWDLAAVLPQEERKPVEAHKPDGAAAE